MRHELPINQPDGFHDGLESDETDADKTTPIASGDQVLVDRDNAHEALFREQLMKHLNDFRHYAARLTGNRDQTDDPCSMRRSNTRWTGAINGDPIALSKHGSRRS